ADALAALGDVAGDLPAGPGELDVERAAVAGIGDADDQAAAFQLVEQAGHGAGAELGDARQLGHVGHALGELLDGQELAEVEVVADLDQFVFPARTHGVADLPYEQAEGRAGADGGGGHGGGEYSPAQYLQAQILSGQ